MWEAVKQHGGSIWSHPSLVQDRAQAIAGAGNVPTAAQTRQAEEAVENEMKAMFMLAGANKTRHEDLRTHLQNSYTVGRNEYPSNTTELLSMMNNWKANRSAQGHHNYAQARASAEEDGLNFAQQGEEGSGAEKSGSRKSGVSMIQSKKSMPKSILRRGGDCSQVKQKEETDKRCIHCGGPHGLETCPEITTEQLGELLIQLGGPRSGQMIFQDDEGKGQ